jgi:hypothetical protein
MLSKLFKHEMKATSRLLLPIYLILVVLTIMDRIVLHLDVFKGMLAVIPGFITFAYITAIIAIIVVSFVIVILRFYKNLMTDEGYLMFTLPVKSHDLINSKLIASFLWTAASVIVVIASLFLVFITPARMDMLKEGYRAFTIEMQTELGSSGTLFIIEMIFLVILSIINNILVIYASIALGQLFNGHKVIGSFAAYIAISTITQIVATIVLLVAGAIFSTSITEMDALPKVIFPVTLLFTIIFNVAFYWMTNYIFNRKLNLE